MRRDPFELVERLTGCAPQEVAAACSLSDLRATRQLVEEALEIKEGAPALRMVGGRA